MLKSRVFDLRGLWCLVTLVWLSNWTAVFAVEHPHAATHVLIKFKSDVVLRPEQTTASNVLSSLSAKLSLPKGAALSEPEVSHKLRENSRALGGKPPEVDLDRFLYLHLPPGLSVEECIRRYENHPAVEFVEPDYVGTGGQLPNDPLLGTQWHHRNFGKPSASIHTPEAWDITQGASNVLVAVIDTGLGTNLAEFAGRVVPGYNFAYGNSNTADDHGHGTAVAGTLCASANNGVLAAGVDWRCRLLPIKALDSKNTGEYSWWAQAIDYAVSRGCKVINASLGGSAYSATLANSINNAMAKGVIFVTITHNYGSGTITFPGSLASSITVGATDKNDARCGFSNYGSMIDLVAPGTNINSVGSSGAFQSWWGTSFAAPQVAGVCSLLAALRPQITPAEARNLLCAGAEDRVGDGTDTPGFDSYYGWGRLNAYNTLLLARTRIDQVQMVNSNIVLSWPSPANASNKQPFLVEFSTGMNGTWIPITTLGRFAYETNRTFWTGPQGNTNQPSKVYRVRIRNF